MIWYDRIIEDVAKIDAWAKGVESGKIIPEKAVRKPTLHDKPPSKVANKSVVKQKVKLNK